MMPEHRPDRVPGRAPGPRQHRWAIGVLSRRPVAPWCSIRARMSARRGSALSYVARFLRSWE